MKWRAHPALLAALEMKIMSRFDRCCHGGRQSVPQRYADQREFWSEWFGLDILSADLTFTEVKA